MFDLEPEVQRSLVQSYLEVADPDPLISHKNDMTEVYQIDELTEVPRSSTLLEGQAVPGVMKIPGQEDQYVDSWLPRARSTPGVCRAVSRTCKETQDADREQRAGHNTRLRLDI